MNDPNVKILKLTSGEDIICKTFDECKGKLVNDYQQYLEQRWVDDLKKEFTIKINNDVFERVKKQLQP